MVFTCVSYVILYLPLQGCKDAEPFKSLEVRKECLLVHTFVTSRRVMWPK